MDKIRGYVLESYKELVGKVTWPSLQELQKSALVVLVASMIIALLLLFMDLISNKALGFYYGL